MKYGKIALLVAACTAVTTLLSPAAALAEYDTPYLSVGAELTDEEEAQILKILEVSPEQVNEDTAIYVTGEEERRYLEGVPGADIGDAEGLSSCKVVRQKRGRGIHVKTYNITLFTPEMYANALATCGVYDANVTIAALNPVFGSEAFVGAMAAWSKMNGQALDSELIGTAAEEMIVSAQIADVAQDAEKAVLFIAAVKSIVLERRMDREDDIREAIEDVASQLDMEISPSHRARLIRVLKKIGEQSGSYREMISEQFSLIYKQNSSCTLDLGKYRI